MVKKIITSILFLSLCVFSSTINLTDTVVIDDFNDSYGDAPNQNTLGAVYGISSFNNQPWLGGGYWFATCDNSGSFIKNGNDELFDASKNMSSAIDNGVLHLQLSTKLSTEENPYAVIKCDLLSSSSDKPRKSVDLSGMESISLRIKGNESGTDIVRMAFETEDFVQAKFTWGYYGKDITLPKDWTTIKITPEELTPEPWSDALGAGWQWSHGSNSVLALSFSVKGKKDAEIYIDRIAIDGLTYQDLGFKQTTTKTTLAIDHNIKPNSLFITDSRFTINLQQEQNVSLSIYSVSGRKISTIFNGKATQEIMSWNSKQVPAGSYLAVLSGKDFSSVQCFTIAK